MAEPGFGPLSGPVMAVSDMVGDGRLNIREAMLRILNASEVDASQA